MYRIIFFIALFSVGHSIGIGIIPIKPLIPINLPTIVPILPTILPNIIPIDLPITNITTQILSPITGIDKDSPIVYNFLNNLQLPEINIPNLPCNNDQCISDALNSFIRLFSSGNPLIRLPSIDPLYLKTFNLIDERNDINGDGFRIRMLGSNAKFEGFGNSIYTIKGVENILNAGNVTMIHILIPKFHIDGDHSMDMKFHGRHIFGNGRMLWDLENLEFTLNLQPIVTEKTAGIGKYNLNIGALKFYFIVRTAVLNFSGLFDGDQAAELDANNYINDHIPEFFDAIRDCGSAEWESVFSHLLKPIFEIISIDGIFNF